MSSIEESFAGLIDLIECMVVIVRDDGTIAHFNRFAEEITGAAAAEVLGRNYFDLFLPESARGEVEEHFRHVLSGAPRHSVEHPLLARGVPLRWVECSFRRMDGEGRRATVLLTVQDITARRHAEQTLRRRTHDLGERIKELNCLFGLSKLVEEPEMDLRNILDGLVRLLPPSWQYPDVACGRVLFQEREFKTGSFRQTRWCQTAPIAMHGETVGAIEVYYLEEKPEEQEGPFLAEERRLLNALAERVGRIAEHVTAKQELQWERDFAESLIQTAPAMVLLLDTDGRILRTNRHFEEISGFSRDELQGKSWFESFLSHQDFDAVGQFKSGAADPSGREVVGAVVTRDGRKRQVEWFTKSLQDVDGSTAGLMAIGQDITERKELEKEIAEISTREQQRLGRELHDGLGQELTGIGYLAESLFGDLQRRDAPEAETARMLTDCVQTALDQARAITRGLVPVGIEALGLVSALDQLMANTEQRSGIACRFQCPEPIVMKDTATATQLFRILQEAIHNAVKHAKPDCITLNVEADESRICFRVRDDGLGIRLDPPGNTGMGLRIMKYRAEMIGATLSILPEVHGGTAVSCTVPRDDSFSEQEEECANDR